MSSNSDGLLIDLGRSREVLSKLHRLVSTVSNDIGQHSVDVADASRELTGIITGDDILNSVAESVDKIIASNEKLQTQLSESEFKLELQSQSISVYLEQSRTDVLTGLPNRRAFNESIDRQVAEWKRVKIPFCVMMIDVDDFKRVNDEHGHVAGDDALRHIGRLIAGTVRDMDFLCRYGGEEFVVILPATDTDGGIIAAERLCHVIEASNFTIDEEETRITVSTGITEIRADDGTDSIVERADKALYHAKGAGKNRASYHDGTCCKPASQNAD